MQQEPPTLFSRLKKILQLAYRLIRWKTFRGGWYFDHLRSHTPFRKNAITNDRAVDVMVAIVDHFEPTDKKGDEHAAQSVQRWCEDYGKIIASHTDSDGVSPQHSWFHRFEYLNPKCLEKLSWATFNQWGEVEFHLHHGYDTHETFSEKINNGLDLANQFGAMLTAELRPQRRFGYIAGNWALDNGRFDDSKSGCNTELLALRQNGCFADFTFPAIGTVAQPKMSNSIYYATDCARPKSYDTGTPVQVNGSTEGDLMIIQGISLLDWENGYIEASAIESFAEPNAHRIKNWIRGNVHVAGRPEWIFVKLHTHGIQSRQAWFGKSFKKMFLDMESEWKRPPFRLHYVTAREMYNIIKAAEAGHSGNPNDFRNFLVERPFNRLVYSDKPLRFCSHSDEETVVETVHRGDNTIYFYDHPIKSISGRILTVILRSVRNNELLPTEITADGEIKVTMNIGKSAPFKIIQKTPPSQI